MNGRTAPRRFVVIGFAAGSVPRAPLNLVLLKGSTVTGYEIAEFQLRRPGRLRLDDPGALTAR